MKNRNQVWIYYSYIAFTKSGLFTALFCQLISAAEFASLSDYNLILVFFHVTAWILGIAW